MSLVQAMAMMPCPDVRMHYILVLLDSAGQLWQATFHARTGALMTPWIQPSILPLSLRPILDNGPPLEGPLNEVELGG